MQVKERIDQALGRALASAEAPGCPPRLAQAMRHAVFPGGARIRPQLCLAVSLACGDRHPRLADAAASAIELLHCASLVHDDLPCFDDAATRRGVPSVHAAYGERLAVLAGDALIVLAFQSLAIAATATPQLLVPLLVGIGRRVGMPLGIVAGQGWECEPAVSLAAYQRLKTGSLFAACTEAGALAHFDRLIARAQHDIPRCEGAEALRALVRAEAERLLPAETVRSVAQAAA
jgi:geranylgeranyl diphosphate synthase type II